MLVVIAPSPRPPWLALLVVLLAACSAPAAVSSFDPSSPCTTDGRQPGAYAELEAALPASLFGAAPLSVDSGRSCTADALGTLYERGVREARFAGATWDLGGEQGVTYAVFEGDGLDPTALIDFYEAGARATGRAEALQIRPFEVGGASAIRMDTIHRNVGQTIIAWPSGTRGRVNVVLASATGETELTRILEDVAD